MSKRKEPPSTPSTSDEDEPSSDEEGARLDWRMDPIESHSDWAIEILALTDNNNNNKKLHATSYRVHKVVLSVGFKRCGYFQSLLAHRNSNSSASASANAGFVESQTATSRIELQEPAAQAFPTMLDYLYSPWKEGSKKKGSWINAENSVALHFLGRYFDCRALRHQVRNFWKLKRPWADGAALATVYQHAKLFQEDKAYEALVARLARGGVAYRTSCARLIEIADFQLWLDALEVNRNNRRGEVHYGCDLSHLVATVCTFKAMDAKTFLKLSDPLLLPEIEASSVFPFLEAEKKHCPQSANGELTNLQKRCVAALSDEAKHLKKTLSTQQQERLLSFNPRIYPAVLELLLERTKEELQRSESIREKQAHCIKKFGYMYPYKIHISGAGARGVNGSYRHTGYRDGAPKYVLTDVYINGDFKNVEISYVRRVNGWFIWIVDGEVPDEDFGNTTTFYGCEVFDLENEKSPRLPPESSVDWSADGTWGDGDRPLPRLEFYYEDD